MHASIWPAVSSAGDTVRRFICKRALDEGGHMNMEPPVPSGLWARAARGWAWWAVWGAGPGECREVALLAWRPQTRLGDVWFLCSWGSCPCGGMSVSSASRGPPCGPGSAVAGLWCCRITCCPPKVVQPYFSICQKWIGIWYSKVMVVLESKVKLGDLQKKSCNAPRCLLWGVCEVLIHLLLNALYLRCSVSVEFYFPYASKYFNL